MEQNNTFNLYNRKNELYTNILNEKFGVSKEEVKSLQKDIKSLVIKFEEKMVEAEVKTLFEDWVDNEINNFKNNLYNVYFKHYNNMLSNALKNDPTLILNNDKFVDFINLTIEYTKFTAKEVDQNKDRIPERIMFLDGFQSYVTEDQINRAVIRVKNQINDAIDNKITIEKEKNRIISNSLKTYGLDHLDNIMDANLSLDNIVTENEMELNFNMNSDNQNSYYQKDQDVTYLKYRGIYFKAYGKYDSLDEFFENNNGVREKADDYVNVKSCLTENGYKTQLKEGSYYYIVQGEFYKSDLYFNNRQIADTFNQIRSNFTKIDNLENAVYGPYQMVKFGELDNNMIQDIRTYSKQNVLNILKNIDKTKLDDKTKVNSYALLKDSLKAFKTSSNYALEHLPWYKVIFKPIIKYVYNKSIDNLVDSVKETLSLSNGEIKKMDSINSSTNLFETLKGISESIVQNNNKEYELDKYIDKDENVKIFDEFIEDKEQISVKYHFGEHETEVELSDDDKWPIVVDELENEPVKDVNNVSLEEEINTNKKDMSK